ncbi:dihydrolipoyl dehydrogenase [Bacteroidetes bacterium endosymbiont of Geopemphigus sp.]|uniref:dihydrolipoyl dehydrogenase n=1 Tax=Bacteroidetes bacterium endosymbiont of Geopemphigus sp. TaxID=2047937 RepID=UPI000CD1195B|nr:dihydrolipoyl dehydrogenase [Bacteroidetes bacterium endosymbiont of Geopemphigus sp.]
MNFNLIVIGSGPGGYVAAIRAAQLGLKTVVIEKEELGGICLNWGCIPTKALLKSAQVFNYLKHVQSYGLSLDERTLSADFPAVIKRSREVAQKMSKGISFLMRKNKIKVIFGVAKLQAGKKVSVLDKEGKTSEYTADHIIIATGARSRNLPNLPQDGKKVIGYRQALVLSELPKHMVVVGSGAIGAEFAYFYNAMGAKVTLVEYLSRIVPLEDSEISQQLERSLKKNGVEVLTSSSVERIEASKDKVKVFIKTSKEDHSLEADVVLSAVGITPNIEDIGLEEVGIAIDKGRVVVDHFYRTSVEGYYAIGDLVQSPALAHVASAEGVICVEHIKGLNPEPLDYGNIPSCTYCGPEIASVGLTEEQAREKGYDLKIGKFPFTALGRATANGDTEGFVKVIFDAKYGEWLGCHMIGTGVTEMIAEAVTSRKLETTGHEVLKAVHPHPTLSEAIMEATANAYDECIHL